MWKKSQAFVSLSLLLMPTKEIRGERKKRLNPAPLQGNEYCSGISTGFAGWAAGGLQGMHSSKDTTNGSSRVLREPCKPLYF
ncbi:hypothetical protein IEQ34_022771 [Dendrobium chrysotoxum]|uniref:Secreted protein n=1 Tax=Dendrobium chrysotoxum TaxID=161865 RepID=A0AAV7FYT1_DENCH|nr:hypothetical protein IEQ34_022771 [Dendrobium chrysotoxum]